MSTAGTATQPDLRTFLYLLRETCRYLMQCGCSSNRVELLAQTLGASWGFEVEALAIPTGVWLTVRRDNEHLVELLRIRNWAIDLDRLARINELVDSIHARNISLQEAIARLKQEAQAKPPYGVLTTLIAGGGTSPILLYNYGGSAREIALAMPIGVLVQALTKYVLVGNETRRQLIDFIAGAFVALYACMAQLVFPDIDVPRLIVGGIVVLLPGLVLVNAMHEVAQKNLVSGAAKLLEAMVIAASLGCGVAFVLGIKFYFMS